VGGTIDEGADSYAYGNNVYTLVRVVCYFSLFLLLLLLCSPPKFTSDLW
jgi:hypothetical protein